MLTDLHAHTSGISRCCRAPARDILLATRETGINSVVLTNHYQDYYVENGDYLAFAEQYVKEFETARLVGEELGVKVRFGIELTAHRYNDAHLLIYGVDTNFVFKHPQAYFYTQEQLFSAVQKEGGIIIWAHPYRGGFNENIDLNYLNGLEINCHPRYFATHIDDVTLLAKDHGLIVTCGGDYHADTAYRPDCGTYLPDDLSSIKDIVSYLKGAKAIKMRVHEPDQKEAFEFTFEKAGK